MKLLVEEKASARLTAGSGFQGKEYQGCLLFSYKHRFWCRCLFVGLGILHQKRGNMNYRKEEVRL